MTMRQVLVTGGCGFIGSNFVRWLLERDKGVRVVNLDKLTYAGNPENLRDVEGNPRYRFLWGDVADPEAARQAVAGCSHVAHFAAETHVDRSIADPAAFLRTNVLGTYTLLEAARQAKVERFLQISTDEVYGSLPEGSADEGHPLLPNSPYAASKTGADHLVRAYRVTHGLPALIVRASNNYGPCQFPEKFLPLLITNAVDGEPLPIYGDGQYIREWLFVEDFCSGIDLVLREGKPGEIYNVGSGEHRVNLSVARTILKILGRPDSLIRFVTDRPGHDRRYALNSGKIRSMGWAPGRSFEEGLEATVRWYQEHPRWWRPLKERVPDAPAHDRGHRPAGV